MWPRDDMLKPDSQVIVHRDYRGRGSEALLHSIASTFPEHFRVKTYKPPIPLPLLLLNTIFRPHHQNENTDTNMSMQTAMNTIAAQ